jgi:hypothetical protein
MSPTSPTAREILVARLRERIRRAPAGSKGAMIRVADAMATDKWPVIDDLAAALCTLLAQEPPGPMAAQTSTATPAWAQAPGSPARNATPPAGKPREPLPNGWRIPWRMPDGPPGRPVQDREPHLRFLLEPPPGCLEPVAGHDRMDDLTPVKMGPREEALVETLRHRWQLGTGKIHVDRAGTRVFVPDSSRGTLGLRYLKQESGHVKPEQD